MTSRLIIALYHCAQLVDCELDSYGFVPQQELQTFSLMIDLDVVLSLVQLTHVREAMFRLLRTEAAIVHVSPRMLIR